MNDTPNQETTHLHIWQENLNKSSTAQHCILSGPFTVKNYDIVALQEPHIDHLGNTRATPDWNVVYPTHKYTHKSRSQAVTLIHKRIDTNNWRQLPFPSADVVVTQFNGTFGKITIFNIYDNSKLREVIPLLNTYLDNKIRTIQPNPNNHIMLMGDFNAHHHLWEEAHNAHLCTPPEAQETAQRIIKLLADQDMRMALPRDRPTLQSSSSSNWTRPDNVFCTTHTLDAVTICDTAPRRCPPCTDHVPILCTLDLVIPHTLNITTYNYREVDWEAFNGCLN